MTHGGFAWCAGKGEVRVGATESGGTQVMGRVWGAAGTGKGITQDQMAKGC